MIKSCYLLRTANNGTTGFIAIHYIKNTPNLQELIHKLITEYSFNDNCSTIPYQLRHTYCRLVKDNLDCAIYQDIPDEVFFEVIALFRTFISASKISS